MPVEQNGITEGFMGHIATRLGQAGAIGASVAAAVRVPLVAVAVVGVALCLVTVLALVAALARTAARRAATYAVLRLLIGRGD